MTYEFKYTNCNICGSKKRVYLGKRIPRAFSIDRGLVADIVRCKDCGLIFPYPTPFGDEEQLIQNFSNPSSYFPVKISDERLLFYESILNKINRTIVKQGRILDVGCGRGEMLYVAKRRGWDVSGVDVSPDFSKYAKDAFGIDVKVGDVKRAGFASESFDAITLLSVLDHVHDPKGLALEANRILKQNGVIFIEVMNNASILYKISDFYYRLQGKKITTRLSPTFPSFQLYGFSKSSIIRLLQDSGFEILNIWLKGGISQNEKMLTMNLKEMILTMNLKEMILRSIRILCFILATLLRDGHVLEICARKRVSASSISVNMHNSKSEILFVPYGSKLSPASRYRVYQYLSFLANEGIEYRVYSIISERMTKLMINAPSFGKMRKIIYYLQISAERSIRAWKVIWLAGKFNIVFLQRTTFPFYLEKILRLINKNIIFDIDDSIYMPDSEEKDFIGRLKKYIKKKEVISILKASKCVIAENNHIKNFVQKYCNKIYIITGPINTVRNYAKRYGPNPEEVTIGWIGSPSTIIYVKMLDEVMKELSMKYKIKVRLIGTDFYSIKGVKVEVVKWSEMTEVSELHKFDIGIMPMPDNEWTRGKVGCKMLQYMANAIPAVVSYTPTNEEVIKDGINGFLARSQKEWIQKLSFLIEDPALRERIGMAGRKMVEEKFSVTVNAPRYFEILKNNL